MRNVLDSAFELPVSRHEIEIRDCGEFLEPIPNDGRFVFSDPHPYRELGAPYGDANPFALRSGVLRSLCRAALLLSEFHPGHRFKIYDAYRPIEVQAYMVDHVADEYCRRVAGVLLQESEDELKERAYAHSHAIWAPPTTDRSAPPPHSTGAAVDLTIVDAEGRELDMGSEIDEHENAHPEVFLESDDPEAKSFHKNRELLRSVMEAAGFVRLSHEWWHFSMGDQHAVFERVKKSPGFHTQGIEAVAIYGRIE